MDPQTYLTRVMPIPEWMWILGVLLLALAASWLGYRCYALRRGLEALDQALRRNPLPKLSELPEDIGRDTRLHQLSKSTIDTVVEVELQRASAEGVQRVHQVLLDQVNDALFIVDEIQVIRFANEASKLLFPASRSFVGRQLIEVCLDHRFSETVELAMKTNGPIQEHVGRTGDNRTFLIEAGPVDPEYLIGEGAWIMIRDITAELHTEQIRQDFVANASHELRTPLCILKGYLEMMTDDPQRSKVVKTMLKHTDRLVRIVDDMLMISRMESSNGNELSSAAIFDIGECIEGTIEQLQPMIDDQNARVSAELPDLPEDREICGDRFYWDQILFNLVENALKQNPKPGLKIKVKVRKEETGRFKIEVIDNGVGIPAADLSEVFKRFYRVEKSHSNQIKGTGLGLSIVKRAVEAHHGTIEVKSQPGTRTCFTISLPGPPVQAARKSR